MSNLPTAQARFDDLRGTAAADLLDGPESLAHIAAQLGLDLTRYAPVGASLMYENRTWALRLYLLDHHAKPADGRYPVVEYHAPELPETLWRHLKMAELVLWDSTKDPNALHLAGPLPEPEPDA